MDDSRRTALSKFLSLILRHRPHTVGIALDEAGWVDVDVLLTACAAHGRAISRAQLDEVVATSPKQRFALSEDGLRIRANQGHSVTVELGYEPAEPPAALFHGTVRSAVAAIQRHGLLRMKRHHVHLSPDEATAQIVASRRGEPVILRIDAAAMCRAGHVFFRTPNGVWLTEHVPSAFLSGF